MKKIILSLVLLLCSAAMSLAADVTSLTDANRSELIDKSVRPYVIDFNASWCGPCRMFAPTFHKVAKDMGARVDFYSVDVDNNPQLCTDYGIRAVPTIIIVNPRTKKQQIIQGLTDEDTFVGVINKVIK